MQNTELSVIPDIVIGSIVTVITDDTRVCGDQGIVVDINSDYCPEDGPIAVFFDKEVYYHKFWDMTEAKKWKGVPTLENYRSCPRIFCFRREDLKVEERFSPYVLAARLFGRNRFHSSNSWNFPLIPGTHACQMKGCESGVATELTLVNIWGTVCEVYTCKSCHNKVHGMCGETLDLKNPLPGASRT